MSLNISDMNTLSSRPTMIPPSGVQKIEYLAHDDVESVVIKYPVTDLLAVTPKPGKSWNPIYFTPKSVKTKHASADTPAGETHSYNLEQHLPVNRIQSQDALNKLRGRQFFVRITFLNNNVRIFGEPDNGIELTITEHIATGQLNPDGYDLNWHGVFKHPAFYDFDIHANDLQGDDPQYPASGSPNPS